MKDITKYQGVIPAFYACYDAEGNISTEGVKALTRHLIAKGVKGVYVGGSSGECIYQHVDERKAVLEAVMSEAKGKLTVIAHVTCHVASIEANLALSDPSDSSVSCRQTGDITPEMIAQIDRSKSGEVVFAKSKSIFFKTMKIRRIYDADTQTLLYVSYSTKETTGSFKHSLSTVPLWGTSAYQTNAPKPLTSL